MKTQSIKETKFDTKSVPEKFVVGEWVDFRQRVGIDSWSGNAARVYRINGLEVYVYIDGNMNESMCFFPRRSDGKHVRVLSRNGPVPDFEFAPSQIFHGRTSEAFARSAAKVAAEKIAAENKKKESLGRVLGSLRNMFAR